MTPARNITLPLAFWEASPPCSGAPKPAISYAISPYVAGNGHAPQPVLRDRFLGTPLVDLNDYRCSAVIDWIKLRLETQSRHQARNMQPAIAKMLEAIGSSSSIYVSGPNGECRHIGDQFILIFQAPKPHELFKVMSTVLAKYAPDQGLLDLQIAGIEISVDFYVRDAGVLAPAICQLRRWQMVDILRRHLRPEPVLTEMTLGHPRVYGDKLGGRGATFFVDTSPANLSGPLILQAVKLGLERETLTPLDIRKHTQPVIDKTAYIGPEDFHVMLRTMNKTTDKRYTEAEKYEDLPVHEYRARLEVALLGSPDETGGHGAVDLETLADLAKWRFKSIRRPCFEFFLPTFSRTPLSEELGFPLRATEEDIFSRSGVYGLDKLHRSVETVQNAQYRRKIRDTKPLKLRNKGRLVSWTEMNQKIDRALKKLDQDWARAKI